jgi:hypothetical protein
MIYFSMNMKGSKLKAVTKNIKHPFKGTEMYNIAGHAVLFYYL